MLPAHPISLMVVGAVRRRQVYSQQSGQTVLGWLTERTLTEARILLRHSSMMMYEISDYLHFSEATAFGSYFKKHTGMTPLEYRENK